MAVALHGPSISATELAASSVGTSEITDLSIVNGDVSASAAIAYSKLTLSNSIVAGDITANAVIGSKIPEQGIGEIEQTAVVLDHADASPKELLAADASNDRIVWVRAVATEAAAGEPDIDVGSGTTDPNGIVDDFDAGAWVVGDRFEGMLVLPKTENLRATIAAAGTAGAFNVYITALTPLVQTAQIAAGAVTPAKVETDLIQYADVQVTNAQMLALLGTDITLVATPGANRALLVHALHFFFDATGAYTLGSAALAVGYGSDGADIAAITEAGFLDQATDQARLYQLGGAPLISTPVVNVPVVLRATSADMTVGDAANTLSVRTYYSVVDMAAFS